MNMIAWLLDLFFTRRKLDNDWRYVAEPPNWACRRGGIDYW
jgi:hypothetical protein